MVSRKLAYLGVGLISLVMGLILGFFWLKGAAETKKSASLYQKPPISERTLDLSPTVVNLLGDGETPLGHYLRVQVQLVFRDQKALDYGQKMEPLMKDVVLSRIGNLSYTQALSPGVKDRLKTDIKDRLNHNLGGDPVEEVLITEYIVE